MYYQTWFYEVAQFETYSQQISAGDNALQNQQQENRNRYSEIGNSCETICKHRIFFPSIQHLAWLPRRRPQGKQKCGKNSDFWTYACLKHLITRKLLKINRYMLLGVWQALNCLSIHATYCVIIAGASPGETKNSVGCGTWKWRFFALVIRITEIVEDRWVHAARQFVSIEFFFHPYNI